MKSRRQIIVYVAGPHTGDVDRNIVNARVAALRLWSNGFTALCPHLNTAHFENDCYCKWRDYMEGDLAMLKFCHAVYLLKGWENYKGSVLERYFAKDHKIPVFTDQKLLIEWADEALAKVKP